MQDLLKYEEGDADILIPASMLHDIGWSEVSTTLQFASDERSEHEALLQHIQKAPAIIRKLLSELHYQEQDIERIIEIVQAHKFTSPKASEKEKRLLIDADTLSDTYKESFYADAKAYEQTPLELWKFRSKNVFYFNTAKQIFKKELQERLKEIQTQQS